MTSTPHTTSLIHMLDIRLVPVIVEKWLSEAKAPLPDAKKVYWRQLNELALDPACVVRLELEASEWLADKGTNISEFLEKYGQDAA